MRKAIAVVMMFLGWVSVSFAYDTTAASCSAADIQQAIDQSSSTGGGTVRLPACRHGSLGSTRNDGDYICFYTEDTWRWSEGVSEGVKSAFDF